MYERLFMIADFVILPIIIDHMQARPSLAQRLGQAVQREIIKYR